QTKAAIRVPAEVVHRGERSAARLDECFKSSLSGPALGIATGRMRRQAVDFARFQPDLEILVDPARKNTRSRSSFTQIPMIDLGLWISCRMNGAGTVGSGA